MRFPVPGTNLVAAGHPRYRLSSDEADVGRVEISSTQYFDGVSPATWEVMVGGYKVCEKWLKDRRGRALMHDDVVHYQELIAAVDTSDQFTDDVDKVVASWLGGE